MIYACFNIDCYYNLLRSNGQVKASVRREAKKLIAALKSVSSKKHVPLSELSESKRNVMVSKSAAASCGTTSTTAADCKDSDKKSADLNTTMSTLKRKNRGKETILFLDNGVLQEVCAQSLHFYFFYSFGFFKFKENDLHAFFVEI